MRAETKNKLDESLKNIIFERAYEIENQLSADNYFYAELSGVKPESVPNVALELAIREIRKTLKE